MSELAGASVRGRHAHSPWDQRLAVWAPAAAVACVILGLRLGAPTALRGALVYAAAPSRGQTELVWQVVVFDEDHGLRTPVSLDGLEVIGQRGTTTARWSGRTTDDGVAEVQLPLSPEGPVQLEVRSGGRLLAEGAAVAPAAMGEATRSAEARFARREGSLVLDVAVMGERAASSFPASIWVRVTDTVSGAAVAGATVVLATESSLTAASTEARTDGRGWAHITATPMGYVVPLTFEARATGAASGRWVGALFVSPGAGRIVMPDLIAPDDRARVAVTMPSLRRVAYLEVDDANGRAWAAALGLAGSPAEAPHGSASLPPLAPGLYWAVASSDPSGATKLGPGAVVRPFFVARSAEEALAFGPDQQACARSPSPTDEARVVSTCLAIAAVHPVSRELVLDGLAGGRVQRSLRQQRGLAVAVGATVAAGLLEALLLVRLAQVTRARIRAAFESDGGRGDPVWAMAARWGVALLVALLGFALLAAFLLRLA